MTYKDDFIELYKFYENNQSQITAPKIIMNIPLI